MSELRELQRECGWRLTRLCGRWSIALGLLPALALACVLVSNLAERGQGLAVEQLQLLPGTTLVDISPNRPMRIVGEVVEDGGDGLEPLAERFARPQSLLTKPLSNKQKSCYSKVCRKCWQECNEGMGTCVASPGYALPGSVCTRVWNKQSDCSNSIKAFEVGGGSEYLNRDNKYHFAVAAWSQCAHGLTPNGRPW